MKHFNFVSKSLLTGIIFLISPLIYSSYEDYYRVKLGPNSSNYGNTGLMEMPTARFMEEGTLKFGISASSPHEYTTISAVPFSWFEATYRYTEVKNRKYSSSPLFSGNQTLKDKGFDLKIGLFQESYYLPQISIGMRDLAGTALFASEYIVASKNFGNFDATIGMGWGALGRARNIRNPLIDLNEDFKYRNASGGQGGAFNVDDWFSGEEVAVFGGLEYNLKKYGLKFAVEYDTTNLDEAETPGYSKRTSEVKSRFNVGVSYPLGDFFDLALSLERGHQLRFSFFFKGNYSKDLVPKLDKPKNVVSLSEDQKNKIREDNDIFYRSLNKNLREETIYLQGASYRDKYVDLAIAQARFRSNPRAIGRTARIASALLPEEIEEIIVHSMNGDHEVNAVSISRSEFDKVDKNKSSPNELLMKSTIYSSTNNPSFLSADFKPSVSFPEFHYKMSPALKHQIGGPEAFYLGQVWWRIDASIKFRRNFSLHTTLGFDIYNNFKELNNPSGSDIPHVRSDIQDYLKEGENNIAKMKLDYIWSPYKDLFVKLEAGLLEEMFGGYGTEFYYRPFNSKFSFGLMLHKVKQRGFKQRFNFRDYETETGHFQFYYDWPGDVTSQLLVGKYLAKDYGMTLDLSRQFHSGFTLGIFATKTDLSAEEFGEGSFDKGFYFAIPVDLFLPNYQVGKISFGLHPLTKDGGAMLNHHNSLYGMFGSSNNHSFVRDWQDIRD